MTKKYIINPVILDLVTALYDEGYDGVATLCNTYPSGVAHELAGCFSIQLTGFCKENLYLVITADTKHMHAFGRYQRADLWAEGDYPTVEAIVDIAYRTFVRYESRGYELPQEFKALFIKYGYIEEKTELVTTLVRKK